MKKKIKTFFAACSKNEELEEVDAQPGVTDAWTICFLVMSERQIVTQCDCQYRALSVIVHSGRHCLLISGLYEPGCSMVSHIKHTKWNNPCYTQKLVSNFFSPPHDD